MCSKSLCFICKWLLNKLYSTFIFASHHWSLLIGFVERSVIKNNDNRTSIIPQSSDLSFDINDFPHCSDNIFGVNGVHFSLSFILLSILPFPCITSGLTTNKGISFWFLFRLVWSLLELEHFLLFDGYFDFVHCIGFWRATMRIFIHMSRPWLFLSSKIFFLYIFQTIIFGFL